ncbi:hypothetical protein GZ77_25140 [Endozoicomonas montiporae]|uniref:Uncharacterized protein n=2 Tax=Endozoicomonas montiporae TaxID=1027273 RepID=A0A081MYX6_9GAMM|nr:hypothetical protein [Endozoicomonas montiporae]AMO54865.1 hypothetical protein EZMO1_0625 [Endozoicomonas montiporae CL-33]KEQ11399.1 hypothetical protein GZ77_25140 [Endozoicomonas montiporae]
MRKVLNASLPFALLFSLVANSEPCWQHRSIPPADGSLCILAENEVVSGKLQWYFGRTALDLDETDQSSGHPGHFCAYEALINGGHIVKRSADYLWLDATADDVKSRLQKIPLHENSKYSPDPSDKWVLDSASLAGLFKSCSIEKPEYVDSSEVIFCARPLPEGNIGFGKVNQVGRCKLFDAEVGEGRLQMSDLQAKRKALPDVSWVGDGWAIRNGQSFATHSVYGLGYSTEYCLLQAMIRGHKYCSVDKTGHYQTGDEIDFEDKDHGINDVFKLNNPASSSRGAEL